MGSLSKFRLDEKKSVDGVWRTFGAGIEVKIARLHNPEFNKFYAKISEPYRKQIRAGILDVDILADLMKQTIANCVIRGFKGLEDDDGKPIKYTPEKALEIISDPANVIFYDFVLDASTSVNLYFEEQKKAAEKN